MALLFENTAEGGSPGSVATAENSGGASGTPFDNVLGTIQPTYEQRVTGTGLAYWFNYPSNTYGTMRWNVSAPSRQRVVLRFSYYLAEIPTTNDYVIGIRNNTTTICNIRIRPTGEFQIQNGASTLVSASNYPGFPTGEWVRVELEIKPGTTTSDGTLGYQLFHPGDTVPFQSWSASNMNAGTLDVNSIWIGRFVSIGNATNMRYDDIRAETLVSGFIGPAETPVVTRSGTAATTAPHTTAAVGKTVRKGSATATASHTTAAIGRAVRKGSALTSAAHTATAIGRSIFRGVAAATAAHSTSAAGTSQLQGTAGTAAAHTATAEGTTTRSGTAGTTADHTVTATGVRPAKGEASTSAAHTTAAEGRRDSTGTALTTTTHDAAAVGQAPEVGVSSGTARAMAQHTAYAAGTSAYRGDASTPATHSTYAAGVAEHYGSALAAATHTSAATGVSPSVDEASGTAGTSAAHSTHATGSTTYSGTARASAGHTTSASGRAHFTGAAVTAHNHTTAATGVRPALDGGSGTAYTGSTHTTYAQGKSHLRGTATAYAGHTVSSTGRAGYHGTALITHLTATYATGLTPGRGRNITVTVSLDSKHHTATLSGRSRTAALGASGYDSSLETRPHTAELTPKHLEARLA